MEDDDVLRRGLVRLLSREGFEVVEFVDGDAAVPSFEDEMTEVPDIVICDYPLPGRNGLEMATAVRHMIPEAGFILISASVPSAVITEADQNGGAAVLEMPLGTDELFEECSSIISDT